jgi:hypothetical protein
MSGPGGKAIHEARLSGKQSEDTAADGPLHSQASSHKETKKAHHG